MNITTTSRGFLLGKFKDAQKVLCSIQKSSSVVPHIWLGPNEANPTINGESAKPLIDLSQIDDYNVCISSRMHLTQQHVKDLLKFLKIFLKKKSFNRVEFFDSYQEKCSIKILDKKINLGIDKVRPLYLQNGWKPLPFPVGTEFTTHMILNRKLVKKLKKQLKYFAKHGELKNA